MKQNDLTSVGAESLVHQTLTFDFICLIPTKRPLFGRTSSF